MKLLRSFFILLFILFYNFLSFSYTQWIDLHFSPLPEGNATKSKIFVRKVIDMREEKGEKEESQDFTLTGLMRNMYGIPFPIVGVLPGHEIDKVVKAMTVNALRYAGYNASLQAPDGSAPVIDIGLLRFLSDGYSYGYVTTVQFRISVYAPDGKTKIFETEVGDNQGYAWNEIDIEDACPAWTLTLNKILYFTYLIYDSGRFSDALSGSKPVEKNSVDMRTKKLTEIPVVEKSENMISANFMDNKISKISNLDKYPNLLIFNIKENKLAQINNLDSLKDLEALVIKNNKIPKIEKLDGLKKLKFLDIGYNPITKIENLDELKDLEWLMVNNCDDMKKIEGVNNLTNLIGLDLNNCEGLTAIENLDNLKKLTFLSLATCKGISQISGLDGCTNLRELIISKTGITRLENLDKLENLEYLDISFNKIKKLENLGNLKKLKKLVIFKSPVEALENLEGLTNLKEIIIAKNYIVTPKPKIIKKATYDQLKANNVLIDGQYDIDKYIDKYNVKIEN